MKTLSYKQRKRITMYTGLVISSLAFILLFIGLFHRTVLLPDNRTFSTFIGQSFGIIGAGLSMFFQTRRLLHDPERLNKSEVREMDERNQYIAAQAARLAFWVNFVLTYVAAFSALFFSVKLYFFLCIQILVMLVLYLLFSYVFSKILY